MSVRIERSGPMSVDFTKQMIEHGLAGVNKGGPFGFRVLILETAEGEAKLRCEIVDAEGKIMRVLHDGVWIYVGHGDGFTIENVEDCFKISAV